MDNNNSSSIFTTEKLSNDIIEKIILNETDIIKKNKFIENHYEHMQSLNWTSNEIKTSNTLVELSKLDEDIFKIIWRITKYFQFADKDVSEDAGGKVRENNNTADEFVNEEMPFQIKKIYQLKERQETVHRETYSKIFEIMVDYLNENFNNVIKETLENKFVHRLLLFSSSRPNETLFENIIRIAAVEQIFFTQLFSIIEYVKTIGGYVTAIHSSNQLISRDERSHVELQCILFKHFFPSNKIVDVKKIYSIVDEAVRLECEFIENFVFKDTKFEKKNKFGNYFSSELNYEKSKISIENCANDLLEMLGVEKIYKIHSNLNYMETFNSPKHFNIFETSTTYRNNISNEEIDVKNLKPTMENFLSF